MHRSGFTRPPGPELALALVNGFCQYRLESRWLPSGAEKKRSQRGFCGRRRDPSLRATPSFRDRGAVALRTGPGAGFREFLGKGFGAEGRTRTDTGCPQSDFESDASTNFATPALVMCGIIEHDSGRKARTLFRAPVPTRHHPCRRSEKPPRPG